MSLSNLPEMAALIDAARRRINALQPKSRSSRGTEKRKIIYSLMGDIMTARAKSVSYKDIAKALSEGEGEGKGITLTGTTLRRYIEQYEKEEDAMARKLAMNLAMQKD